MSILLADIGGTHIRFALANPQGPQNIKKYRQDTFSNLQEAVRRYMEEENLSSISSMAIASTSWIEDGEIQYKRDVNNKPLGIDVEALKSSLDLDKLSILNDLEAACYGLPSLDKAQIKLLRDGEGSPPSRDLCLLSVGTGVGHSFYLENTQSVRKSFGGFIPLNTLTENQARVRDHILNTHPQGRDLAMEDVVSARGLRWIYETFRGIDVTALDDPSFSDLLQKPDEAAQQTIQVFCEFLGLHAQILLGVSFAYGGLYLTGGVIDHLMEHDLFDVRAFEKFFIADTVVVVKNAQASVPVFYCRQKNMPLVGLNKFSKTSYI